MYGLKVCGCVWLPVFTMGVRFRGEAEGRLASKASKSRATKIDLTTKRLQPRESSTIFMKWQATRK